ncbi:conserved hypothetical protein [Alphaproteobacteria bacterium]
MQNTFRKNGLCRFSLTNDLGMLLFVLLVLLLSYAAPLHAIPAPLSERELFAQSDLVADLKVIGVVRIEDCTTVFKEDVPAYQAWAQVLVAQKGDIKPDNTIIICWQDIPHKAVGPWKVEVLPGEVALMHLKWNNAKRCYTATHWNAKITKTNSSVALPKNIGDVHFK